MSRYFLAMLAIEDVMGSMRLKTCYLLRISQMNQGGEYQVNWNEEDDIGEVVKGIANDASPTPPEARGILIPSSVRFAGTFDASAILATRRALRIIKSFTKIGPLRVFNQRCLMRWILSSSSTPNQFVFGRPSSLTLTCRSPMSRL